MKQIELNEVHSKIIYLFLEKLELLSQEERRALLKTINLINNPMFMSN